MSLSDVSDVDDRLSQLRELRGILSRQIDVADSTRDFAALVLRFQSVISEIEELAGSGQKVSAADEIAERRRRRGESA